MSVNREKPHVLVLPEDEANRQLADGFHLQVDWDRQRQMQVLVEAGGWTDVLELFQSVHVAEMEQYPHQFLVLLIDFDKQQGRLAKAKAKIPEHLKERVFLLGAWSQPEALKSDLGSYDDIGGGLAKDCREGTDTTWGHELLRHNAVEVDRLRQFVRPILFPAV